MLNIVEMTLVKYRYGTTPSSGEVLWAKIVKLEDAERKRQAANRLALFIEMRDKERHYYALGDKLTITRERKDADFNTPLECVYERKVLDNKTFHKKAAQRLARYLSKKSDTYNYYGGVPLVGHGTYCYQLSYRSSSVLSLKDKMKTLKDKTRGRKSAITRNKNRARAIKESYKGTLFPDDFKTDKRYMSLISNLPHQEKRLKEIETASTDAVETVIGGYCHLSKPSLNKLIDGMAA